MSTTVTTTKSTHPSTETILSLDNSLEHRLTPSPCLPVELLQLIIAQINDRGSLHALTLSSHFLRYEAEPYLYASPMSPYPSLDLPIPHPSSRRTPTDDPTTHISFLRTVCNTPRLALLVRSYHSLSILKHIETPLWRYTAKALRMMKELKELRLRTIDGRSAARSLLMSKNHPLYEEGEHGSYEWRRRWVSDSGGGLGRRVHVVGKKKAKDEEEDVHGPSFQLHTFHWGCFSDKKGITAFLKTQNTLRALSFPGLNTHMYLQGLGDAELGRLTVLEFGGTILVSLAKRMVGLEVLELVGFHEDLTALHTLPSLHSLILSTHTGATSQPISLPTLFFAVPASGPIDPTNISNQPTSSTPRPRRLTIAPPPVASLFASCAKLECVDVELCAHLIPPVILDDFIGNGGEAQDVRLYARWKGRQRWIGGSGVGENGGFELLMVDEVRRGRLIACW